MILQFKRQRANSLGASVSSTGTLAPSLVVPAATGIAPFAVQFDATGTTSTRLTDSFRQAVYSWNYGDTGSSGIGTWEHSGRPKNSDADFGAIGGHVYADPGTYTATVQVFDGFDLETVNVVITVQDPNTVYAGALTVCISTDGSTGWGPAGCTYQTTLPTGAGWNGKRFLFKRGQDFRLLAPQGVATIDHGNHNVFIGAAGSGAKPMLPHMEFDVGVPTVRRGVDGPADYQHHWTFHDVEMMGTSWDLSSDVTFYKCKLTGVPESIKPGNELSPCIFGNEGSVQFPTGGWAREDFPIPSRLALVENEIVGNAGDNIRVLTYMQARQVVVAGNTYSGGAIEHGHRSPWYWKLYDCHNKYGGYTAVTGSGIPAGPGKTRRTARTSGFGPGDSERVIPNVTNAADGTWFIASRYCIIAWNKIGDPLDVNDPSYPLEVSAQSNGQDEGSEDILVMNNRLYQSGMVPPNNTTEQNMAICGRRFTYFNNFKGDTATLAEATLNWKAAGVPPEWQGPYFISRA